MIQRISDLRPELEKACRELAWKVKHGTVAMLEAEKDGKTCVIDAKEHTGPIFRGNLEQWTRDYPQAHWLILVTMGFFAPDSYRFVLATEERRQRILLISLGLRDYFDREFKPRRLIATDPPELLHEVESALKRRKLPLVDVTCSHCNEKAITFCEKCGALLCKDHYIPCAVCRTKLCHPDIGKCFFTHECR